MDGFGSHKGGRGVKGGMIGGGGDSDKGKTRGVG